MDELEQNRRRRILIQVHKVEAARQVLVSKGHPANILSDNFIELNDLKAINHPDEIASLLVQAGTPPMQLIKEEEELERYFLRLVGMNGDAK